MTATASPPRPILDIFEVALRFRIETSDRIAHDANGMLLTCPDRQWEQLVHSRRNSPACQTLATAARSLLRMADAEMRPFVKRATRRLHDSVVALAEFRPYYVADPWEMDAEQTGELGYRADGPPSIVTFWNLDPASLARLDELRVDVYAKLVELESLFNEYPDALTRVVSVAERIAGYVARRIGGEAEGGGDGCAAAERVRVWLARFQGEGGGG